MILRRLGNKKKVMPKLVKHFPPFKIWIETFFGSGSAFFYLPVKPKYAIVNDLDSDVYNLFQVVMNQKDELKEAFYLMPIHSDLLKYWKTHKETDPIKKALRFLFLSNVGYMGKPDVIRFTSTGTTKGLKDSFKQKLDETYSLLYDISFNNCDFEKFLKDISFPQDGRNDEAKTFIYNDPPYISTGSNYENQSWGKDDFIRLLDANIATGCKFAVSEFGSTIESEKTFAQKEAEKRGLNVIIIGERQNLKNRRTEILITNYKTNKTLFD